MSTPVENTHESLNGKTALVAGASRGAGRAIARELAARGALVYVTGRTANGRQSDQHRAETLEETVDLIVEAGGQASGIATDHSDSAAVAALVERIRSESGRLDIAVNALWGGEQYIDWNTPIWRIPPERGRALMGAALDTHLMTAHHVLGLLIENPESLFVEVTDGTNDYNGANYRSNAYYDLAKTALSRLAFGLSKELEAYDGIALAITPGWMRTEMMLEEFGVTEANWLDARAADPHFAITETPWFVARAIASIAEADDRSRWNGSSTSSFDVSGVYGFTDVDGSRPDCWRYNVEVKDRGLPADVDGYR